MRNGARIGLLFLGLSLSAACSSGLKYRLDDAALASVPAAEQQAVLAAKGEVDQATLEVNNARAELGVDDRDVAVAQSEYGQAKLEVDKAEAEAKLAEQTKDVNRTQAAAGQVKLMRLGKQVADTKVDWLKQRRRFHESVQEAAEKHLLLAQAHHEQAKAQLAQQKGIKPSQDFNVANFDQQVLTAQSKWDQARVEADRQKLNATQLEGKYNQLAGQYAQQRGAAAPGGVPGASPQPGDPMGQPGQPAYPPPGQ